MKSIVVTICCFCAISCELSSDEDTQETNDHKVEQIFGFMELPGIFLSNIDSLPSHSKITISEDGNEFTIAKSNSVASQQDTYGLVYLNKKKERGLPTDPAKRKKLFDILNSKSEVDGITHWYIIQMRSASDDLIGVYGQYMIPHQGDD